MLFLKHFEGNKKVWSLWSYSPMLALHAAGINYASDICICIDFNKRNFIHASYCTCAIITWGYQHSKCTLPHSHRHWLRVSLGKLNTKNLIKIIIKYPLVWSSGATDTAEELHLICYWRYFVRTFEFSRSSYGSHLSLALLSGWHWQLTACFLSSSWHSIAL